MKSPAASLSAPVRLWRTITNVFSGPPRSVPTPSPPPSLCGSVSSSTLGEDGPSPAPPLHAGSEGEVRDSTYAHLPPNGSTAAAMVGQRHRERPKQPLIHTDDNEVLPLQQARRQKESCVDNCTEKGDGHIPSSAPAQLTAVVVEQHSETQPLVKRGRGRPRKRPRKDVPAPEEAARGMRSDKIGASRSSNVCKRRRNACAPGLRHLYATTLTVISEEENSPHQRHRQSTSSCSRTAVTEGGALPMYYKFDNNGS